MISTATSPRMLALLLADAPVPFHAAPSGNRPFVCGARKNKGNECTPRSGRQGLSRSYSKTDDQSIYLWVKAWESFADAGFRAKPFEVSERIRCSLAGS